jgi:DNA-binding IclR family transcriptional regulator
MEGGMSMDDLERGSGARLLLLLNVIAEQEGDFALKDLAQQAGMPISSVHRLLQVLVRAGMVERSKGTAYRAGRELFRLASHVLRHMDYRTLVRPYLRKLWDRWQETAVFTLYRPMTHKALVVEVIQTPHPLRHVLEPDTELSLFWGSLGRSILAFLPEDEFAAAYAEAGPGPITHEPPAEMTTRGHEMEKIRVDGVAFFVSEAAEMAGVAAPVFGPRGSLIGSLGLTQPAYRFARLNADEVAADVRGQAAAFSEMLSFRKPSPAPDTV